MKEYKPMWPKTVMFWGAGATASLGFKTTKDLGEIILKLCKSYGENKIYDVFNDIIKDNVISKSLENLFKFIDSSIEIKDIENEIKEEFNNENGIKRIKELREYYDWNSLRKIIRVCPNFETDKMELQDLFNVIEMHTNSKEGFYISNNGKEEFLLLQNIIKARNALIMIITLIHSLNYNFNILKHKEILEPYYEFAKCLGVLMQKSAVESYKKGVKINSREFYMCNYSVVSLNWDPILLWMIFNANRELNNSSNVQYIGSPAVPLKLFNDMGSFMAVRKIDEVEQGIWYPFNETIVQRLNDTEHVADRRVKIGQFYFPHGTYNWRECPNCGKVFMYLGNEWKKDSNSLFPPLLLPNLSFGFKAKSSEEQNAVKNNQTDFIQCPFCGTMVSLINTPVVMQSNFKGNYHPSIENVQRDMRVSVENAEHILLMGYTVPKDDFIYRSMFVAKNNRAKKHTCSVVVGKDENFPDRWLNGDELQDYIENKSNEDGFKSAVRTAFDIFGKENVRGYGRGIPDVFMTNGQVDENKVKNLIKE